MSGESVAAVIPTMDRPKFAKKAIQSAINQEYENLEIIVVDGSNSDDTAEVVSRLGEKAEEKEITYIHNEQPQGLPAARNQAVSRTDAKYIAFLDDDDIWYPDKTREQVSKFHNLDDSVAAIHTGYKSVDERGKHLHTKVPDHEGDIYEDLLVQNVIGTPSTVMVLRSAFEQIGGFDPEYQNQEDWEFYIRLADKYNFGFVEEPLMRRTIHENTMSHDVERQKQYRERILDRYKLDLEHHNKKPAAWSAHHRKAGIMHCRNGAFTQGRRELKKSLRYSVKLSTLIIYMVTFLQHFGFDSVRRGKQLFVTNLR